MVTESKGTSTLDADALLAEIARAPDAQAAMQRAVEQLKAQLPHYTWVGIYLLEGQELVLGRSSASRRRTPPSR
jgi:putative methionine-R-sulfoxide reductase with GAF domain